MPKHNGVELGERSPLLTAGGRKRYLGPSEHDIQALYIQAIGHRLSAIPDLATLHAVPNGGKRDKATAGKLKAEGLRPSIPDVHWPVARGPFIGLWIEFKQPGKYPSRDQRAMHEILRKQGHCVVWSDEVQAAIDATLGYDALGWAWPDARHITGFPADVTDPVGRVLFWREVASERIAKIAMPRG